MKIIKSVKLAAIIALFSLITYLPAAAVEIMELVQAEKELSQDFNLSSLRLYFGSTLNTNGYDLTTNETLVLTNPSTININGRSDEGAFSNVALGDIKAQNVTGKLSITIESNSSLLLNKSFLADDANGKVFINGLESGGGSLVINNNLAISTPSDIGSIAALGDVTLKSGSSLSLQSNNNSLSASKINLGSNSVINVGTSSITGNIFAETNGLGTVNFKDNNSLAGNIGSDDLSLKSITIAANKTLTATSYNLLANSISIADGAIINGDASKVAGALTLGNSSKLNLTNGSSLNGSIIGSGGLVTIDSTSSLSLSSSTLKSSISATNISINDNAVIKAIGATLTSNVSLGASSQLNLTNNSSVNGVITGSGAVTLDSTSSIFLNSLTLQTSISGASANQGSLNINANQVVNIASGIGEISSLANINLLSGSSLNNTNYDLSATNISIGNNAIINSNNSNVLGVITLASSSQLNLTNSSIATAEIIGSGAIILDSTSSLFLNNTDLEASVNGAGSLIINENKTVTTATNIGSTTSLNNITLESGSSLNLQNNNNSLSASKIHLKSGSKINVGTASIAGEILASATGLGTVNFKDNNSLAGNIGSAVASLNSISITNAKTLVAKAYDLFATNISIEDTATIDADDSNITGNIIFGSASTLNLTNGSSLSSTSISIGGGSVLSSNNSNILGNVILEGSSKLNLANGSSLSSTNISISEGSILNSNNSSILGAVTLEDSSELNLTNGSSLDGSINGSKGLITLDSTSSLSFNSSTLEASIIATNIFIKDNAVLEVSGASVTSAISLGNSSTLKLVNSSSVNAAIIGSGTITLDSTSSLALNSSDLEASINGNLNKVGSLIINKDQEVTTATNIGETSSLKDITLKEGSSLNLQTNNNSVTASVIYLESDSVINIGTSSVSGKILSKTANTGTVNFKDDHSLAANIGSDELAIKSITVDSGKTLATEGYDLFSRDILIEDEAIININGSEVFADVTLGDNSELNLTNSSSLNGSIKGPKGLITIGSNSNVLLNSSTLQASLNGPGSLTINAGQIVTTSTDIGSEVSLREITLEAASILNLHTNNNSISAAIISLKGGSVIEVGSKSIKAEIITGDGTINFREDNTWLQLNSSPYAPYIDLVMIDIGKTLDALDHDLLTKNISMSDSSVINSSNNKLEGDIILGTSAQINLSNTETKGDISLGNFAQLNLRNNSIINGTISGVGLVKLDSTSSLSLNTSTVGFSIDGLSSGEGSLVIESDKAITTAKNIGSIAELSKITLKSGSSLNLLTNNSSISATNIILEDNSAINVGLKSIKGDISSAQDDKNWGTVNFRENNSLLGNIGLLQNTSNFDDVFGLHNVTISSGKTLSAEGYNIKSKNILISNNAVINASDNNILGTIQLENSSQLNLSNTSVIGDIILADSSQINLSNDSIIDGSIIGDGIVNFKEGEFLAEFSLKNSVEVSAINIASEAQVSFSEDISNNITFSGTLNLNKTTATQGFNPTSLSAITYSGNIISGNLTGNGGILNLGSGTHYVSGNLTLNSQTTLAVKAISDNKLSSITVSGAASIASNTKLELSLDAFTFSNGSIYKIISAQAGSAINTISNVNINVGNSGSNIVGKQEFTTLVVDNGLFLKVSEIADKNISPPKSNVDGRYYYITNAINPTGNLLVIKNLVESGADEIIIAQAVSSVAPQADNAINTVSIRNTDTISNIVLNRLSTLRGVSSDEKLLTKSIWTQTFGSKVNQDNIADFQGYDAKTYGFTAGIDKEISNDTIVGINLSYSNTKIDSKDKIKDTKLSSYQINLYGSKEFESFFINGLTGVAVNKYRSNRSILLVQANAISEHYGQTIIGKLEAGKSFNVKNHFVLTSTFTITGAKNRVGNYLEEGAGSLNLKVSNKNTSFFETRFGLKIGKAVRVSRLQKIHPTLYTSYGYDFAGSKQRTNSRFIGQSEEFTSSGARISQGSFKFGSNLKIFYLNSFSLDLDYNFEHRLNYNSHSGSAKIKYEF